MLSRLRWPPGLRGIARAS